MRSITTFILTTFMSFALSVVIAAQTSFFMSTRPEAAIVVRKHAMGSDLVDLTISSQGEWEATIRERISSLGRELSVEPRGVAVSTDNGYFRASFAINGLVNDTEPRLNLPALARALAFGSKPIRTFSVFFEGVVPNDRIPARWFAPKEAWLFEGIAMKSPPGIEYRVKVNTKDPTEVTLPGSSEAKRINAEQKPNKKVDFVLIAVILVASAAIGVLVYSALTRSRS
jgi:hypothetical protein